MTKDRLKEFREKFSGDENEVMDEANANHIHLNLQSLNEVSIPMNELGSVELDRYLNEVASLMCQINEVTADIETVRLRHSQILSTPVPDDKKISEVDSLMSQIRTTSRVIQSNLKEMLQKTKELESDPDTSQAYIRIRKIQHSACLHFFMEAMYEYQKAQVDYRDRCKGRIKRQIEITGSHLSDDEVENMLEEGNWSVFTQGIIVETEQARQMLADVEARHDDIIKLEKSLVELHRLFQDMAILVESQGEKIDSIESNVSRTKDWVENAKEQLVRAEELQSSARRKKIYIILILIAIAVALILLLVFTV